MTRGGQRSGGGGGRLARIVARRLAAALLTLLAVSLLIFVGTNVLPGDVASAALGRQATPEAKAELRRELGLDRPAPERYVDWLGGVATGDLGESLAARRPVADLVADRLQNTLLLALVALVVLVPLSLLLGVIAAARAGRPTDAAISGTSLAVVSVPEFVIGTLLVLVFSVSLTWLPSVSLVPPGSTPLLDPKILVLPTTALVLAGLAYMTRIVRAGMVDALGAEYIEMARLNGVAERRVVLRHALRNALAPSVQALALTVQWLIGGVVVIEVLFAYPGLGEILVNGVRARDVTLVQSAGLIIAAAVVLVNALADLVVVLLVPRLRTSA